MSPDHSGDMIEAGAYSVEELREAVFEGRGRVARPLALALLTRKDYGEKVADLQRILDDEKEQPRLRALAASGLGEVATPASVRALERGLQSQEPVTMRASAKALANVGTRKHVELLEGLARSPGPVGRDAQRAVTVLSERLKAGAPGRADVRTLRVEATGKPTRIRVETPKPGEVANAVKSLPSRKLARRAAVGMTCQGRRLVFAFDEVALGRGLDMFKRGGEVGIVAEPPGVEGVEWSPRYRVAVEPQDGGAFRVFVTTHDGRLVYAGRGTAEGREAVFELATVDAPGALPVEIRGRFDGQKVTIDQARSAVRRKPSRNPTREGSP
jgi:HEAT repeat protein